MLSQLYFSELSRFVRGHFETGLDDEALVRHCQSCAFRTQTGTGSHPE